MGSVQRCQELCQQQPTCSAWTLHAGACSLFRQLTWGRTLGFAYGRWRRYPHVSHGSGRNVGGKGLLTEVAETWVAAGGRAADPTRRNGCMRKVSC